MSIHKLYEEKRPVLSFEVFPPKKEADGAIEALYGTLARIARLKPDFVSVTCGAGGVGGSGKTLDIAGHIQTRCGVRPLAHLTCAASSRSDAKAALNAMHTMELRAVLALRGDLPPGQRDLAPPHYRYAEELIRDLRGWDENLSIGAACYPEGHIDCENLLTSISYLRRKQEAGANFCISQLFFENELFFRFLELARREGVTLPISAGVMPILSRSQIERMIFLCGASLPSRIVKLLHKYETSPADLRAAGIDYACAQVRELTERGVDGVHIYTMNRPEISEAIAAVMPDRHFPAKTGETAPKQYG